VLPAAAAPEGALPEGAPSKEGLPGEAPPAVPPAVPLEGLPVPEEAAADAADRANAPADDPAEADELPTG
jgi:hypothetical protein